MFSKLIRRIHMYLALFLSPWILMYAISTFAMNHHDVFMPPPGGNAGWVKEGERKLNTQLEPGTPPAVVAQKILAEVGLEGAHNVNARAERVTILRTDPLRPTRITYTPADGNLVIEKQHLWVTQVLAQLHMRRGFQTPFAINDAWAVSVDAAIVAILLWVLSGVWMWWELKVTRRLGGILAAAGCGVFTMLFFMV